MSNYPSKTSEVSFTYLNKAFWLLWGIFFLVIGLLVYSLLDPANLVSGLTDEQLRCLELFPRPGNLSFEGSLIFWSRFALEFLPFIAMMLTMHITIRRFSKGHLLVHETLAGLRLIAIILIIWPFLELTADNLAVWALNFIGDINFFSFTLALDIAPIAGGVFVLAMANAIKHAITIKSEHDLTI